MAVVKTGFGGDINETPVVIPVETDRRIPEGNSQVQIAIVVDVAPGVRLSAGVRKQLRLDGSERWCIGASGAGRDNQRRCGERGPDGQESVP